MVVPRLQGRALAIAMVGTPIALSLGVPLGTWLGGFMGWRMAFGLMSAMTLLLIVWVLVKVPDYPGQSSSKRMALRQVFFTLAYARYWAWSSPGCWLTTFFIPM